MTSAPPDKNKDIENVEAKNIDAIIQREEDKTHFSWGKGILLGVVGKIGGSALVTSLRGSAVNKLQAEVAASNPVRYSMGAAATPADSKAILDNAMKAKMEGMTGLRGHVVRNPLSWGFAGGVIGGVAAIGIDYANHLKNKEKAERNIEDLKKLKQSWAERADDNNSNPGKHEL